LKKALPKKCFFLAFKYEIDATHEISSNNTLGVFSCTSSKISSIVLQYSLKSSGNEKKPYILTLKFPL